jgi:hypothetical protein
VSRYIDINQLLGELGTSDRSAGDPWTLSRGSRGTVKGDAFSPAVVAELGAPLQDLKGEIQSSEQITQAATVPSSSSGGNGSSTGSSFLGGLLNFFPLASGIAKLFGFGDSTPAPALTPYQLPPSINFEGAVSGATAGSLSYGSDGLPRTSLPTQSSAVSSAALSSNFTDTPAATVANISNDFLSEGNTAGAGVGITSGDVDSSTGIASQIGTLGGTNFAAEPATGPSTLNSALLPQNGNQNTAANAVEVDPPGAGGTVASGSNSSTTSAQQGHSILVQVQAMDSQSFMDHSQDIAQAVRQAMLNLNSLNDVVQDL